MGGFLEEGAVVLQKRFAKPPKTLTLCVVRPIFALSLEADLTSAVT